MTREGNTNAFIKFTDECGNHRRHITLQQNGVAERANHTMADDISAMLFEAKLPPSLLGEALSAQIHVWNCLPTSSLKGTTSYEVWFKRKPDVSHFRIWGCLAYVFIQKDKHCFLQPHMEQCMFVGYPSGYKGWKFYNPSTKKYIISKWAEFDECVFPSTQQHHQLISQLLTLFLCYQTPLRTCYSIWRGDGDVDDCTTVILPSVPVPELPPVDLAP